MRILMLCYEFPPLGGGGSRVAYGLSTELARLGHHVDLVTMGYQGLPSHERVHGVQVYRVPCLRIRKYACTIPEAATYLVSALPRVLHLLRQQRYDITHAHFILPDGLIAWQLQRYAQLPYVITAHGSDVPGYNPYRLKLAHKLLAPLWKTITRNAAQIICPSNRLQSLVAKHAPETKLTIIPYGFDLHNFQTHVKKHRRILVVSRMLQRKGVQYLFKALEKLPLDHEIHVVGDGTYLPILRQIAHNIGLNVIFWGWLDNESPHLKKLYETSSIFILPSEAENFPVSLMEAMAAGLAIITTKDTGCEEVVGDAALLVEARNPHAIRAALESLTADADLSEALGQAARRRLAENFSWSVVVRTYLDLYERCTDKQASEPSCQRSLIDR